MLKMTLNPEEHINMSFKGWDIARSIHAFIIDKQRDCKSMMAFAVQLAPFLQERQVEKWCIVKYNEASIDFWWPSTDQKKGKPFMTIEPKNDSK